MDAKQVVTTATLFLLMFVAMTTEKVTLVWNLQMLRKPNVDVITGYLILLALIEGPYLFALLQILWNVPFIARCEGPQFPGTGNVLLGCFLSCIEAVCLVFFAVEVAPIFPAYVFLPILNSVLLVPILVEQITKLRERSSQRFHSLDTEDLRSQYWKWLQVFLGVISCLLPIAMALCLNLSSNITGNQAVAFVTTVFGLSFANVPAIQRYTLAPKGQLGCKPLRITLFYTLLKMAAVIIFLASHYTCRVQTHPDFVGALKQFADGISSIFHGEILVPLLLNNLAAMFAHGLAFISLSWCLPVYGFQLPSVLSLIGAVSVCCGVLQPPSVSFYQIQNVGPLAVASVFALLIWSAPYLLGSSWWTREPDWLFMPLEALFMSYGWNSLFFDQYHLLGYRRGTSVREGKSDAAPIPLEETKSRIFICTTMYREADYEMERLLLSLQGLSHSTKFKNVFLEAHIFMDNGCRGETLNPFAQQLVGLVYAKLGLSVQNGICIEMPYGIQISWTLSGGMPLTLHFKDCQKVKAKKRWSQAMYIHYILNHRLNDYSSEAEAVFTRPGLSSTAERKKANRDLSESLSYEALKSNSLALSRPKNAGEVTDVEKEKGEDWTDIFQINDRNFGHNINRIGYLTLASHHRLLSDGHLTRNGVKEENGCSQVETPTFLENILIHADPALNQTKSSHQSSIEGLAESHAEISIKQVPESSQESSTDSLTDSTSATAINQTPPKSSHRSSVDSLTEVQTDTAISQAPESPHQSSMDSLTGSTDGENSYSSEKGILFKTSAMAAFENEAFVADDFPEVQTETGNKDGRLLENLMNSFPGLRQAIKTEDPTHSLFENGKVIPYSSNDSVGNRIPLMNERAVEANIPVENGEGVSRDRDKRETRREGFLELKIENLRMQARKDKQDPIKNYDRFGHSDAILSEDQVYILATDADMEFEDEAVLELLQLCNNDKRVGAACGRTHPQGKKTGPIVWHQIFEYAKDFWMIKNAQNVIGSVMCCPGCFSLYRASAIRQVMEKYVTPTRTPFTVYVKDTGEDRWLATLLMVQGWYLRYSCFAKNTTFCPDTFEEFLKQRRRWVLSDIANAVLVVRNLCSLMYRNACFSLCYVLYILNMFLNNVITPGTAVVMITAGLDLVFEVPYLLTTIPLAVIVLVYSFICTWTSTRVQTHVTAFLTLVMGAVFFAVVIWGSATIVRGIIQDLMIGRFHFQQHYVIMLITLSFGYAAAMHPRESYMVIYGFAYVFIFPAMHILLPIYSISNIIDQSWGTRDTIKAKLPKIPSLFRCIGRKKKKNCPKSSDDGDASEDAKLSSVVGELKNLKDEDPHFETEYDFWLGLRHSIIGTDVNTGLGKTELAQQLRRMRNKALFAVLTINGLWLVMLSVFYMGVSSSLSRLNIYGVISGALYGFTLVIQILGITACRLDHLVRYIGINVFGKKRPSWINKKE